MRTIVRLFVIVIAVFIVQGCHSTTVWVKYSSNEDGFTVYMPASPKKSVKQEQTAFGKQAVHYLTWKSATFDINKIKLLQVSYMDCPRRASLDSFAINSALDSSINVFKRNYTDVELFFERISIDGYQGRAFIFEDQKENATTIVKAILANNRIYCITAVAKKDYPTNDELNTFFNSFLILR